MNDEQNLTPNLITQARNLLSPYLDDEVTPREKALVESVLAQSPELQTELDGLRRTVNLLQSLPRMSAPRPFTLSEADIGRPATRSIAATWTWLRPLLGVLAVAAAVLIVGIFLFTTFGQQTNRPISQVALAPREAPSVAQAPTAEAVEAAALPEAGAAEPDTERTKVEAATAEEAPAEPPVMPAEAEPTVAVTVETFTYKPETAPKVAEEPPQAALDSPGPADGPKALAGVGGGPAGEPSPPPLPEISEQAAPLRAGEEAVTEAQDMATSSSGGRAEPQAAAAAAAPTATPLPTALPTIATAPAAAQVEEAPAAVASAAAGETLRATAANTPAEGDSAGSSEANLGSNNEMTTTAVETPPAAKNGPAAQAGATAKPTTLPVQPPIPTQSFPGRSLLFILGVGILFLIVLLGWVGLRRR